MTAARITVPRSDPSDVLSLASCPARRRPRPRLVHAKIFLFFSSVFSVFHSQAGEA
jgi:hypothetical protein